MTDEEKAAWEARGYFVGDVEDWLEMNHEERQFVDLALRLSVAVERARQAKGLTVRKLAGLARATPTQVRDIECAAGDSLDVGFRILFAAGGTVDDVVGRRRRSPEVETPTAAASAARPTPRKRSPRPPAAKTD